MPNISLAGLIAEVRNAHEALLRAAYAFRKNRSRETREGVESALAAYEDLALELFNPDKPWQDKTRLAAPLGDIRRRVHGE